MNAVMRTWILNHGRIGDLNQQVALAELLGWPYEVKKLRLRWRMKAGLWGGSRFNLRLSDCDALEPPWPNLVITAESRSVPAARWIGRKSGGQAVLVHLGRPAAPLAALDLIVTTPQYLLPERDNIIAMPLPLVRTNEAARTAALRAYGMEIEALPSPRFAVLAGGTSAPYRFCPDAARLLAMQASRHANDVGGSLLVTTSARTGPAAEQALLSHISAPHHAFAWSRGGDNPYHAYLELADGFIVTEDSVSMLVEATASDKPVWLYRLPRVDGRGAATIRALHRRAYGDEGTVARLVRPLFEFGVLEPRADRELFCENLIARGRLGVFGKGGPAGVKAEDKTDHHVIIERIRALVAQRT